MNKIDWIVKNKMVAIVRGIAVERMVDTAKALYDGGVRTMEITFNQAAENGLSDTVASIKAIRKAMGDKMVIGAGTVITIEQVHAAKEAGADFALSPNVDENIIKETKRLGMVAIPGAFTPSEVVFAYHAGADIVKLFPADSLGPSYVRALRGPINYVPMMAVGGIDDENITDYLNAGYCSCGVGLNIVRKDLIDAGRYAELTELARRYTEKLK